MQLRGGGGGVRGLVRDQGGHCGGPRAVVVSVSLLPWKFLERRLSRKFVISWENLESKCWSWNAGIVGVMARRMHASSFSSTLIFYLALFTEYYSEPVKNDLRKTPLLQYYPHWPVRSIFAVVAHVLLDWAPLRTLFWGFPTPVSRCFSFLPNREHLEERYLTLLIGRSVCPIGAICAYFSVFHFLGARSYLRTVVGLRHSCPSITSVISFASAAHRSTFPAFRLLSSFFCCVNFTMKVDSSCAWNFSTSLSPQDMERT